MNKFSALTIVLTLLTISCAPPNGGYGNNSNNGNSGINKQQIGTVLGGIGGGVLGNQVGKGQGKTVATIGGAILGGMLGNSMGKSLDRSDQVYLNNSANDALEYSKTGATARWLNPDSGNSGTITPTNTYQNNYGQQCREFSQSIVVGGQRQNAYGNACRQTDGSWKIVQ